MLTYYFLSNYLFKTSRSEGMKYLALCNMYTNTDTNTLTLNKIYFDINEKDKQQEIDNMISRYQ